MGWVDGFPLEGIDGTMSVGFVGGLGEIVLVVDGAGVVRHVPHDEVGGSLVEGFWLLHLYYILFYIKVIIKDFVYYQLKTKNHANLSSTSATC